jgi:branched-chain amino acid transport system substrate-binding protein
LTRGRSRKIICVVKGVGAVALLVLLAGLAGACSGGGEAVEPVATRSCSELLYEGEGEPDVIVAADNPLRGEHAPYSNQVVDAIELVLRKREFRAGAYRVGFQSCNYAVGDELDAGLCRRNARAFVATKSVVGVIGPYNSGCAELQIPIVSRTEAGPLAMVSPTNTSSGLTRGPLARSLYPEGVRSYARVVGHDTAQGAAAAYLARRLGARRAVVLVQKGVDDPYAQQLTTPFVAAARALGIETEALEWRSEDSYRRLAAQVAAARPGLVYLAGLPELNANALVEDLRAELGPRVPLAAPDSFTAPELPRELGPVGEGMLVTVPGIPADALPASGKRLLREVGPLDAALVGPGPGAPEAAQATEVLLDAIARSDGTRASVVEELFATRVENGILGSFSIDRFGDIDPAPVGIYRYQDGEIVADGVVRAALPTPGD